MSITDENVSECQSSLMSSTCLCTPEFTFSLPEVA